MTGFHFTGTAVPVLPESWFPFHRIPGSLGPEYSMITLQFSYILMGSSSPILPVMMRRAVKNR